MSSLGMCLNSCHKKKSDITTVMISVIGCAYITPSSPITIGRKITSGIRRTTCFANERIAPFKALPIAGKNVAEQMDSVYTVEEQIDPHKPYRIFKVERILLRTEYLKDISREDLKRKPAYDRYDHGSRHKKSYSVSYSTVLLRSVVITAYRLRTINEIKITLILVTIPATASGVSAPYFDTEPYSLSTLFIMICTTSVLN